MANAEGIQSWAKRVNLPSDVASVLEQNGFSTTDLLSSLTPTDVKECFQDAGLLNMAQCLALKRALASLQGAHNSALHSSSNASPPPHPHHHQSNTWTDPSSSSNASPQPHPHHHQSNTWTDPSSSSNASPQPHPHHHQSNTWTDPSSSSTSYPPPNPVIESQPPHLSYPHPHQPYPPYPSAHPGYPSGSAEMMPTPHFPQPQPQPQGYGGEQRMTTSPAVSQQSAWGAGSPLMTNGWQDRGECFRFLLLGKTGSGKSTTGNTIFGERLFNTAATFASVTMDCERKTSTRSGRKIEILDSPGLYDTQKTQEQIGVVIVQAVAAMHPGPHAILYVVRLGRYTAEEHGAYQRLKALFDGTISRYMIVVFTHGDMLEREGQSITDLIGPSTPQNLKQVLTECNNRYVVFNNMAANPQTQVEHLLQMVRQLTRDNGGQPYSCPKYSNIGQGMEKEVARRLQEVEKRDLQRQKYVQQLEKQTMQAEESARRMQEQFQKNEEQRERQMAEEEKKRQQLEEQLQVHIKEQQIGFEKYQQELQRLHQEREEQERLVKEKEAQMTEMEKKRAKEEAELMRQREQEIEARLAQQEQLLLRQRQEDEERRQQMDRERVEFFKGIEEQRRKEMEELEKRNQEREKLWEKQREEEREAAKRREKMYEKEMEKLKEQVATSKATDFVNACASAIRHVICILAEIGESSGPSAPLYIGQDARRPLMDRQRSLRAPQPEEPGDTEEI